MNISQLYSDEYNILYDALTCKSFQKGDQINDISLAFQWIYIGVYLNYASACKHINNFDTFKNNQSFWLISIRNDEYEWWYLVLQKTT